MDADRDSHRVSARRYDAVVVGSGPAGCSAAQVLASAGARVAVVEKERPPRYKTCGGGIVRRAAAALPTEVSFHSERDLRTLGVNFLETGLQFTVRRDVPIVRMVMRDAFDQALLSAAVNRGADLYDRCEATGIEQNESDVTLHTSMGPFIAGFIIAADGANGPVARRSGWRHAPYLIPALEHEVYVSDSVMERFSESARFDFDVGMRGYAWVFPKRDHLSVGILSVTRGPVRLQALLSRYLERIGICDVERVEPHGFRIPIAPRKEGFVKGRVLLVGDAAGLADPVTAEGISYAIISGQLAASAVLKGEGNAARVRDFYRRELASTVLSELRLGRFLAALLYRSASGRRWLFERRGQKLCEALTDVMSGRKTYRELLLDPHNCLKLLRLFYRR